MSDEPKSRRALPMILIVLATIIGIVSVFALWTKRQVLETDTWTDAGEELIQDAEIQAALSTFLVSAIYDNVDVEGELAERLPRSSRHSPARSRARFAAPPTTSPEGARAAQGPGALGRGQPSRQSKLIALIEDEGEFTSNDRRCGHARRQGVAGGGHRAARTGGEARGEAPRGGELDRGDALPTSSAAQTGLSLLKTLAWFLTVLTLVIYAIAIAIAGDRRRETLRAVGFSFIFMGVVVLFARGAAGNVVVSSLSEVASSDAAVTSTFEIGSSLLLETGQSIVAYGLVIVLAAWLAGQSEWATSARRAVTPYLRDPLYAYGGLLALLALVFWWDPVVATHRLLPSLLLVVFGVIGTEMLRRQVIREFPDRVAT